MPRTLDYWICPCLNPTGFEANRRENAAGTDLNRQYLQPEAHEVIAHIGWLERQPKFDLCLCLHEDWEAHGFYLYELNPDHLSSLAERIITNHRLDAIVDGFVGIGEREADVHSWAIDTELGIGENPGKGSHGRGIDGVPQAAGDHLVRARGRHRCSR